MPMARREREREIVDIVAMSNLIRKPEGGSGGRRETILSASPHSPELARDGPDVLCRTTMLRLAYGSE